MAAAYLYQKSTEFYMGLPGRRAVREDKEPDAFFVTEKQHAKGAWISVIVETAKYGLHGRTAYWVCQRSKRTEFLVERLHQEYFEEEDAAMEFARSILANTEHPQVRVPYRKKTPRDSQRDKVYQWENKFFNPFLNEKLTVEQAREFVEWLCQITGERMPKVTFPDNPDAICALKGGTHMQIPTAWALYRSHILHEFAHYVEGRHAWLLKRRCAAHGPEFVGYFMVLLEKIGGIDMPPMQEHAVTKRVKFILPERGDWTKRFLDGLDLHQQSQQKVAA